MNRGLPEQENILPVVYVQNARMCFQFGEMYRALACTEHAIVHSQMLQNGNAADPYFKQMPCSKACAEYRRVEGAAWYERARVLVWMYREHGDRMLLDRALDALDACSIAQREAVEYGQLVVSLLRGGERDVHRAIARIDALVGFDPTAFLTSFNRYALDFDGCHPAQLLSALAFACTQGVSVSKDDDRARGLFAIAARNGDSLAAVSLAKFEKQLFGGWVYRGSSRR